MAKNKGLGREAYEEAYRRLGSIRAVARELGVHKSSVQDALRGVDLKAAPAAEMLTAAGYRVDVAPPAGDGKSWTIDVVVKDL